MKDLRNRALQNTDEYQKVGIQLFLNKFVPSYLGILGVERDLVKHLIKRGRMKLGSKIDIDREADTNSCIVESVYGIRPELVQHHLFPIGSIEGSK